MKTAKHHSTTGVDALCLIPFCASNYKQNPHPDDVTRLEKEIVEAVEKVFGLGEGD